MSNWKIQFARSMDVLKKLVVVRRNDKDIQPLISPLLATTLKEIIHLNLQEAQWAILNTNPVVYQLAIKQAIQNLQRSFNLTTPAAQALLQQLSQLQQVQLTQQQPAIGAHCLLLMN